MKRFFVFIIVIIPFICSAQYTTHYWYGSLNQNVTVKDSEYYKRLDEIAQQEADEYLSTLSKSNSYYNSGDWESSIHYAKNVLDFNPYKGSAWCNIAASYAQLGNKHKCRKAYSKGYKKMNPEMRRAIQALYNEKFSKKLRRKRWVGRKILLGVLGTAITSGIIGGAILFANEE